MERKRRDRPDEKYIVALGKRIAELMDSKGYSSPYEFWLEHGDDGISRSNLNYILNGKSDPKISSLRRIAKALDVELEDLFRGL